MIGLENVDRAVFLKMLVDTAIVIKPYYGPARYETIDQYRHTIKTVDKPLNIGLAVVDLRYSNFDESEYDLHFGAGTAAQIVELIRSCKSR